MKELKRIRLGNHLLGMRIERLPHSLVFRALLSHVADTAGVLNRFNNTDKMCLFMDLDDKVSDIEMAQLLLPELTIDNFDYIVFETSTGHKNIICPNLISKSDLDYFMKKYLRYMDYRFNYVYFRDGCNAIRITPKIVGTKTLRDIKIIAQGWNTINPERHNGLMQLIEHNFNVDFRLNTNWEHDDSTKEDLIIRRYETINW